MLRTYLSSRFRLLALLAAFLAGVGVTIFSWWIGLILLVVASGLDFLSFFLSRKSDADFVGSFTELLSVFGQR